MPVRSVVFKLKLARGSMVGGLAVALLLMATTKGEWNRDHLAWAAILLVGSLADIVEGSRQRRIFPLLPRSRTRGSVVALLVLGIVGVPVCGAHLVRCLWTTPTDYAQLVLTLTLSLICAVFLLEAIFLSRERRVTSGPARDEHLSDP